MEMEIVNNDMVCHPKHYNQGGIECIDAIKAATVGKTGIQAFCVGNAIKYLFRYEEKNGLQDVEKAKWYIERLIQELYGQPQKEPDDYRGCAYCKYFADDLDDENSPCHICKYNHSNNKEQDYDSMFKPYEK